MKIVAIVQQRMNSTRLPGKAMLDLAGKSMTQNILERVSLATTLDEVVLAFPDTRSEHDTVFADLAVGLDCGFYRATGIGENDLVGRHLAAALSYEADLIVRIPGDNPCVDPVCIDDAVRRYLAFPYIFYSNTTAQVGYQAVDGIGCEVFSLSRLKWLDRITQGSALHREHPHLYFEECLHAYGGGIHIWQGGSALRLDVNTRDEYEFIKDVYDNFNHNRFSTEDVLNYLATKEVHHGEAIQSV